MMKIKVIIPNSGMEQATLNDRETMLSSALSTNSIVSVESVEIGPDSIESNTDEVLVGTNLIEQCKKAERDGFDAVVIYCFSDVGIEAIRENVSIPVIGPGEISLATAGMLSNRFSVITTIEKNVPRTERRLMRNPIAREKMISVRALNIPVVDLRDYPDITKEHLEKVCKTAVEIDRVDAIILGCLGMAQYGDQLREKFGLLIIDPAPLAVAYAELCSRLHLNHSRLAFPKYKR